MLPYIHMSNEIDPRKTIARAILTRGAMTVCPDAPIRWASGYAMPIYIDNRCLIGYADVRAAIAEAFTEMISISAERYDAIAGVATGAIPHATTLADRLKLPLLYIRAKPKDHGQGRQIEGDIPGGLSGKRILVIEDTISTGSSAINAIEAVRREGALIPVCAAIYHYDIPGKPSRFTHMDPECRLMPLITFPYLLEVAREENLLSIEILALLERWYADPFAWGANHGFPPLTQ